MIKKLLHKLVMVWCVYGFVRVVIFIHPWLFWLAARTKPNFSKGDWEYTSVAGSFEKIYTPIAWDSGNIWQNICVWGAAMVGVGVICIAYIALSELADWLFNKDEHSTLNRMDIGQDNLIADMKAIKKKLHIESGPEEE